MARADGRKPILVESLLKEDRRFEPPTRFQERARIKTRSLYQEAEKDLEGFWARHAEAELH
jgi:acetyl-CoA synthetase